MNVLIAEDDRVARAQLESLVSSWGYDIIYAKDGLEAIEMFNAKKPNIILLDWVMPGLEGVNVCKKIRSIKTEQYTYIIMLTAKVNQSDIITGLNAGADDFVGKPFNNEELRLRLEVGKRVVKLESDLLAFQQKLKHQADHDFLTGLYNRSALMARLKEEKVRSVKNQRPYGLIMIDIDHFKNINDTYGHQAGDDVLKKFSVRIKEFCRAYDIVGRFGGEEFIVVLPNAGLNTAYMIAERIRCIVADKPFKISDNEIRITSSFGVSTNMNNINIGIEEHIKVCDDALYKAKEAGRNMVVCADDSADDSKED